MGPRSVFSIVFSQSTSNSSGIWSASSKQMTSGFRRNSPYSESSVGSSPRSPSTRSKKSWRTRFR